MGIKSDVQVSYEVRDGVTDPQKLAGVPDRCWLRGVSVTFPVIGVVTHPDKFEFLSSSSTSDLLFAVGTTYLVGNQDVFIPDDSYIQLTNGLYVTSDSADAMGNFSINVFYT